MEDYNTCTFPSKKYYNLEAWEQEQRAKASKKRKRRHDSDDEDEEENDAPMVFNDEEILRQERKKARDDRDNKEHQERLASQKLAALERETESRIKILNSVMKNKSQ